MQLNIVSPRLRTLALLTFLFATASLTLPSFAQKATSDAPSRITQAIDESQVVTLGRNTRPEANAANDRGALPEGFGIEHMFLLLQRSPQREKALNKLIDQLNDRKSPNFHKWLTAEEFGERFGVGQQDIDTITG